MTTWLNPIAFIGLTLLAGPVIVHLLRRHRSRRVPFPSLRFVQPSRAAAVRLHTPADWRLLTLRVAILGVAVCALAQPVFITSRRLASWNSRVARAVVVDRSAGVSSRQVGMEEMVNVELNGATFAARIDVEGRGLDEAIARAVAAVSASPPARREILLVSPLRKGSLDATTISSVPASIGLRFAQVDIRAASTTVEGVALFGYRDVTPRRQKVALTEETTAVTIEPAAEAQGLRVVAPEEAERDVAALLRAIALTGSPAPWVEQPIAVFVGGRAPQAAKPITAPWMVTTISRLATDIELQQTANRELSAATVARSVGSRASAPKTNDGWNVILRDPDGRPLLTAAAANDAAGRDELLLHTPVSPGSYFAAAIVRAALTARHGTVAIPDREIAPISASRLQAWTRPAAPVTVDESRRSAFSDARWLWALVLMLIGVETIARRGRPVRAAGVDANAA